MDTGQDHLHHDPHNKKTEITRSFRIVGDIGEYYACNQLKLTICMNQNEKGFDAVDDVGKKYEIKTRRIYESSRRVSDRRRLNNLAGKSADFVVVVALDREFACAGMWLIPYRNIPDPANSWITMVNDIPGTVSIVRSRIPGLHNRESIKPAVQKVQRKTIPRKKKVMKGTDDQSVLPEPVEKSSQQEDKVPGSSSMSTWWVLFIIMALLVLYLIARLQ